MINWKKERNPSKRIQHTYAKQVVANAAPVCHWLTYNVMINLHRRQVRLGSIADDTVAIRDTINDSVTSSAGRKKGRRLEGTTDKRKLEDNFSVIVTKN